MSDLLTNASKAESFTSNQPAEGTVAEKLSKEVSNTQKEIRLASKPASACVRDTSGYIDCGPIVGYPHPDTPAIPQPENPFFPAGPAPSTGFPVGPAPESPIGKGDPLMPKRPWLDNVVPQK
jgi:hypothetical protein